MSTAAEPAPAADVPVVETRGLTITYGGTGAPVVTDVNLLARSGEIVGLVGESGSGKSVTCLSLVGLAPRGMQVSGSVLVGGREVVGARSRDLRAVRASVARVVFQDPWSTLNPVLTVGAQLMESARLASPQSRAQAQQACLTMLRRVGISDGEQRMRSLPRQLSGGILQRVIIAMGLLAKPRLLICDEPTTALDATTEIQALDLLRSLVSEFGVSMLLTTHDLGIAAEYTDRLVVLYRGRVVETGPTRPCLENPRHPYTRALVAAVPRPDAPVRTPLATIARHAPTTAGGCTFADSCPLVQDICRQQSPELAVIGSQRGPDERRAACWFAGESAMAPAGAA